MKDTSVNASQLPDLKEPDYQGMFFVRHFLSLTGVLLAVLILISGLALISMEVDESVSARVVSSNICEPAMCAVLSLELSPNQQNKTIQNVKLFTISANGYQKQQHLTHVMSSKVNGNNVIVKVKSTNPLMPNQKLDDSAIVKLGNKPLLQIFGW